MSLADRRERERADRRRLIVNTARRLAEAEGWDAVTTRRLSTEIEYSQPVLYKHFAGMEQLAQAVALEGFDELTDTISTACRGAGADAGTAAVLALAAQAYLDFAREHPAVYDAMFTRTTTLHFATEDTPSELTTAFNELRAAVGGATRMHDLDTATELFWAALHGQVSLTRTGRLRPGHETERLRVLVEAFTGAKASISRRASPNG